jgi:hypothetical protein
MKKMKNLFLAVFAWMICISLNAETINITEKTSIDAYSGDEVFVKEHAELTLTSKTPLTDSKICLETPDSWVIFENLRPGEVFRSQLNNIYVGDLSTKALEKTNVRVEVYKQGTVIIPDGATVQPLEVFTGLDYEGTSQTYPIYNSAGNPVIHTALGEMNNAIRSFKLKKGYMATLATGTDGKGYSRVFIADQNDLEVPAIDPYLDQSVAFIRVLKWKYVSKKGWAGAGSADINKVNATWCYDWGGSNGDWGTTGESGDRLNAEYIPMRHYLFWDGWESIKSRPNSTAALGFNEPENTADHSKDNPDNPSMSVEQCIELWPNLLATGLRLGSPATTDGNWSSYLYPFIDQCDELNYRVDFVAVHYYRGGKSASQLYSELKGIHDRTKRPLWLTEWNNGANWTTETWPSSLADQEAKQLRDMTAFFNMLDTCSFVERYAVYDAVEAKRDFIRTNGTLSPAGEMMRDYNARMGYNPAKEFIPLPWKFKAPTIYQTSMNATQTAFRIRFNKSPNGNLTPACLIEKRTGRNDFVQIDSISTATAAVEYPVVEGETNVFFRMRYLTRNGDYTPYSEEVGYVFTPAQDIQLDKISIGSENWTPVFFGKNFNASPVAIFGTPTYNNRAFITSRGNITAVDKMEFRLQAWESMHPTYTVATPEELSCLILEEGTYDWGGLHVVAAKTTASGVWKKVAFETPFETAPAVFALQTSDKAATATAIRIRNVTTTGFDILVQKEVAQTYTVPTENIVYLAIDYGEGLVNGQKIVVGKTADKAVGTATTTSATVQWGESFENPLFFSFMQTANDNLGATLRLRALSATSAEFYKQTERSSSTSTAQAETAAWMVIDAPENLTAISSLSPEIEQAIYPNPVKEVIYFHNPGGKPVHIQIYSLVGEKRKDVWVNSGSINVNDLHKGYYVMKIDGKSFKFLKL